MVSYCCVKGCSNNSNNKKKDPSSLISFHAFPCNQELKIKWLRAIGRPNWAPPSHSRICSAHFNHDQINYDGCRIRIKDDAIPVSNLPLNSNFEASNVEACRICLATDLKMYSLLDNQLSNCIDSITGFNDNYNIEGLPQFVCYQCAACLLKCYKLIEKSMIAQATLLDIFARNGQITKSLIKQQNRDKLNLTSSLNCFTPKTYYYYKYNDENGTSDKLVFIDSIDIINNIQLKNETDDNYTQMEDRSNTVKDLNTYDLVLKENNFLEDEIKDDDDDLEDSCMNVSDADTGSNIDEETEEGISNYNEINHKKRKDKESTIKKKTARKRDSGLTPDEIDMQKYFDIVKLSLQEQIEEWKRTIKRRSFTSETVYECEVCSKIFAHDNTYHVHISCHDPSRGKVVCPVCKLRFKTDTLAKSHANRAHAKKFYCKTCPKIFNNVGVAKKHQRWHVGYRYSCARCPFSSAHESSASAHARRAHASLTCALCARACTSRRGLALHIATVHPEHKESDITATHRCEACDINFASEGARRVHLLTSKQHSKKSLCDPISTDLKNTCSKCGIECESLSELVTHTRTEHTGHKRKQWRGTDKYPKHCEICGETVSCRRKHWLHVRRQHPKETNTYRPIVTAVCDTCGKGFQNSTKLHLHQLRHGAPTVRCDACPRLFYDKYALSRHAATHTPNKPHQCKTCGRAFKLRSNLERHSRVHTDIAPYECTMCGKKFKYSSSVNLHVRTVHYKLPHPPRKKRSK